jgi:hypothetical protein
MERKSTKGRWIVLIQCVTRCSKEAVIHEGSSIPDNIENDNRNGKGNFNHAMLPDRMTVEAGEKELGDETARPHR